MEILKKQAYVYECFELSQCEVLSRDLNYSQTDDSYILDATYTCRENIAYQQDIGVDNITFEQDLPTQSDATQ